MHQRACHTSSPVQHSSHISQHTLSIIPICIIHHTSCLHTSFHIASTHVITHRYMVVHTSPCSSYVMHTSFCTPCITHRTACIVQSTSADWRLPSRRVPVGRDLQVEAAAERCGLAGRGSRGRSSPLRSVARPQSGLASPQHPSP